MNHDPADPAPDPARQPTGPRQAPDPRTAGDIAAGSPGSRAPEHPPATPATTATPRTPRTPARQQFASAA